MNWRTGISGGAAGVTVLLLCASMALADTGDIVAPTDPANPKVDSGWQAGTCNNEPPAAGGTAANYCSIETKKQFFEQAAGHPQFGFTQIIVKNEDGLVGPEEPVGELKTVRVDLPVGLSVNPQATKKQCTKPELEAKACPLESAVGKSLVTGSLLGEPASVPLEATVYNIVPDKGEPALFGFELAGKFVYLKADVDWVGDYHEGFTIEVPKAANLEPLIKGLILKNRLVFKGRSGNGTFITTPTTCLGPPVSPFEHVYSTWLRADSYKEPDPNFPDGSSFFESRIPSFTSPKECDTIPFEPGVEVDPQTGQTDSPAGPAVEVTVPFEEPSVKEIGEAFTKQASSHVKDASVTLPAGMGLNPSAANGLGACADGQFGKGTAHPVECPSASQIGTVSVQTPPLPPDSLAGNVYLGQQLSRDPTSGQEYRIFVDVESERYGISARLIGNAKANPQTGQLTTTFADNPQVPFSAFTLDFNDGPRAPLTSPPTCGPHRTTSQMTPWSTALGSVPPGEEAGPNTEPPAEPGDEFTLTEAPGGGKCAKTLASRPFAPSFGAHTANPQGGAYSPLTIEVARSDGNQELKGVDVQLPPGLTAKLAGVRYCPEETIAAAAANSGIAEAASPSCPASSNVGSAAVTTGTGPEPISLAGKAFLAGPYHGAPISLAVITPATAGPFDLGAVVVRVALFVDPATAQVKAVSDPIPHVFGGALVDVRSVKVTTDREGFQLNPTNCSPMTIGANLHGGGANPLDPAAFTSSLASAPFQAQGCERLGFKPKLYMRVFGGTRRAKSPKLRATLIARKGDANIGRAAVTLPRPFFLRQSSLAKICTRVQFAAHECPAKSIYGYATAETPLLDAPLKGPVYLRSSDNLLPDLVVALRGQVEVDLAGRIDQVNGRMRNTFDVVPDVPVSKFSLTVRGGKKGLLENSTNLCARKYRVIAKFTGQNGKKANQKPKLRTPCKKKQHGRHSRH
ncbi:MAG: hypothetical protein ACJ75S_06290 [Solirubrobacterales bacterium]